MVVGAKVVLVRWPPPHVAEGGNGGGGGVGQRVGQLKSSIEYIYWVCVMFAI